MEISADRTSLINANSRILEEKEQLEVVINDLQVENNQLKTEKDQLKAEKDQVRADYKKENNQLKAENNQLKVEKHELNSSNQQLTADNIRLKALHLQEKGEIQLKVEQLRQDLKNSTTSENILFTHKSPVSIFCVFCKIGQERKVTYNFI